MASSYSVQDIQSALDNQLISPQDAEFLAKSLEPQGSALGAAGSALLGAGAGGLAAKGLGMGARALQKSGWGGETVQKGAAAFNQKMPDEMFGQQLPGMVANRSQGAMASGLGLGATGAAAGAYGGSQVFGGEALDEDTAEAFKLLVDPATDKRTKQQIMMYLEQKAQGMQQGGQQPAQQEESNGANWQEMLGMGAGGLAGGAASLFAGNAGGRALSKLAGQGADPTMMQQAGQFAGRDLGRGMNPMGIGSAALGGGAGAWAGQEGAEAMMGSQYADPLM